MFSEKYKHYTLNSSEDFKKIREELRSFGIENFKSHLRSLNILDNMIKSEDNFFAKKLTGVSDPYIFIDNLKSYDDEWESTNMGNSRASMSKTHKFLVFNDFSWENFNIIALGMETGKFEALKKLDDFENIAKEYAQNVLNISSENIGLYFHCYPTNSIHITHLHIIDESNVGPQYFAKYWKNLPLEFVRKAIIEEN